MMHQRTIPAPYLPRPAGRPSAAARPGEKVHKKPGFSLDKYDWRNEVSLGSSPRSLPLNSPHGITLIEHAQVAACGGGGGHIARPQSMGETKVLGGVEVGLEELIQGGRGKREKRATMATTLGFDFIANPTITAISDTPCSASTASSLPACDKPLKTISTTTLSIAPRTPGLEPAAEQDDDDDEWEHISSCSEGERRRNEGEDDMIVLGELELDDAVDHVETTGVVREGKLKRLGKEKAGEEKRRLTYAAMLGKA